MYNRYIRNDAGVYQRIPVQEDPPPSGGASRTDEGPRQQAYEQTYWEPPPQGDPQQSNTRQESSGWEGFGPFAPPKGGDKKGFLSGLLGKLKLDEIDTGDLLLLVILFLLFKDGEDEELLIALGLLLIL